MKNLFIFIIAICITLPGFSQRRFHDDVIVDSTKTLKVGSYWNPLGTTKAVAAPGYSASWYSNPTYPELNTLQGSFDGPGLNNHLTFGESIYPGGQHGLINSAALQTGSNVISLVYAYNQKQINFNVGAGPQWTLDDVSIHSQDSTSKIGEDWAPVGQIFSKVYALSQSYEADTTTAKVIGFIRIGTDLYWGNGTKYKKIN